ncbi:hypothetical protein BASA81_012535 [Batrachochytrium salamandrivorans]|nr:hypothetical protein BASA81_012535 [Batrachochytrium salamandrivorans]
MGPAKTALEALAVDDAGAGLVVLLLGDPHLLEGGERGEDGAADPLSTRAGPRPSWCWARAGTLAPQQKPFAAGIEAPQLQLGQAKFFCLMEDFRNRLALFVLLQGQQGNPDKYKFLLNRGFDMGVEQRDWQVLFQELVIVDALIRMTNRGVRDGELRKTNPSSLPPTSMFMSLFPHLVQQPDDLELNPAQLFGLASQGVYRVMEQVIYEGKHPQNKPMVQFTPKELDAAFGFTSILVSKPTQQLPLLVVLLGKRRLLA